MTHSQPVIAVLDDEPQMRKALSRLLRTHNYAVETFAAGEEFLGASELRRFDCTLLDLHMPGVNGFDVLTRLGPRNMRGPVVVITGHDEPGTEERVRTLGAAAYLVKPLDEALLLATIEQSMGG